MDLCKTAEPFSSCFYCCWADKARTSQQFCSKLHTCLEDLIANRESRSVGLVVGDKLDEELAAGGDDRRRRDFPAKLSQHGRRLIATIVNFHVVVPVGESEEMHRFMILQNNNNSSCAQLWLWIVETEDDFYVPVDLLISDLRHFTDYRWDCQLTANV